VHRGLCSSHHHACESVACAPAQGPEKDVIKKLLQSILEHFEQVAISIETLLNLNSMRIIEATDHLHAVEERK
jgi:hypothetical protein